MELPKKLRLIRNAERLTQPDFCEITGLNISTLKKYETGVRASIASDQLEKITKHDRFKKYALWLVSDIIAVEAGQISAEIETERRRMKLQDNTEGYILANESLSVGEKIRRVNK